MKNLQRAFTLTELVIVVLIISLMVTMAQLNVVGMLTKNTFKAQIHELISTIQMAVRAAAENGKRYEVIVDITEQKYLLHEITMPEISEVTEENLIIEGDLSENCIIDYILFDDGTSTNDGRAFFRAGPSGWQSGSKIVLIDSEENEYTIIINRLNRIVKLEYGDTDFIEPKTLEELPF